MKHLLELIEDLEALDIALVSLNEQIDSTRANGRVVMRMMAGIEAARRLAASTTDPAPYPLSAVEQATLMYRDRATVTKIAGTLSVSRATTYSPHRHPRTTPADRTARAPAPHERSPGGRPASTGLAGLRLACPRLAGALPGARGPCAARCLPQVGAR